MGLTILLVYFCQENNFNFTSNVTITCSRRELPVCLTAGGHEHAKGEHCPHGPLAPGEEEARFRPRKAFSVKRADVVSRSVSLLYRLRTCASWRFEDFSSTLLRLLSGRSPKLYSPRPESSGAAARLGVLVLGGWSPTARAEAAPVSPWGGRPAGCHVSETPPAGGRPPALLPDVSRVSGSEGRHHLLVRFRHIKTRQREESDCARLLGR